MDINDFAKITRRVIAKDGFDDYLPTLCIPERKHIIVLEGVPKEKMSDIRRIALTFAEKNSEPGEEYFLSYKENSAQFRIVHRLSTGVTEKSFDAVT